jgi:hypothetical protein
VGRNKKKKDKRKKQKSCDINSLSLNDLISEARKSIDSGKAKDAIDLSKACIRRFGFSEGEEILSQSYKLRIQQMQQKGMDKEAVEMAEYALEACPSYKNDFNTIISGTKIVMSSLDDLLSIIADNNGSESIIMQLSMIIEEPELIMKSPLLPDDHSLKEQASIVSEIFHDILNGNFSEDFLSTLVSIPRKSPFILWKLFLRGLAAFYRKENDFALKNLKRIPEKSCLFQASEILLYIMELESSGHSDIECTYRMHKIIRQIVGEDFFLKRDLKRVDKYFNERKLPEAIRCFNTIQARFTGDYDKYLLNDLRSVFLSVGYNAGEPTADISGKVGVVSEARKILIMAEDDFCFNVVSSYVAYHVYLKLMGNNILDVEKSVIYERIIELYKDEGFYIEFVFESAVYEFNETLLEDVDLEPSIDSLYRKCIDASPSSDVYKDYVNSIDYRKWRKSGKIAEEWHEAFPGELAPLIFLANSAIDRSTYSKASKWLLEAEKIDAINSDVRRLRLTVSLSKADKHVTGNKYHLIKKDVEEIKSFIKNKEQLCFAETYLLVAAALNDDEDAFKNCVQDVIAQTDNRDFAIICMFDTIYRYSPACLSLLWINKMPLPSKTERFFEAYAAFRRLCSKLKRDIRVSVDFRKRLNNLMSLCKSEELLIFYSEMRYYEDDLDFQIAWKAQYFGMKLKSANLPIYLAERANLIELSTKRFFNFNLNDRAMDCYNAAKQIAINNKDYDILKQVNLIIGEDSSLMTPVTPEQAEIDYIVSTEIKKGERFKKKNKKKLNPIFPF